MTKHSQRLTRLAPFQFLLAGIIFIVVGLFVTLPGYSDISDGHARLSELAESMRTTESDLDVQRDSYRSLKEAYTIQAANNSDYIDQVIPSQLQQTQIVRLIEEFTNSIRSKGNPILLKTVHFGRVITKKDVDYVTLPFKVTINTSKQNMNELLKHFERSGTFVKPDDDITPRLIDARDVTIQINDINEARRFLGSEKGSVDIDISFNAYALPIKGNK